MTTTAAEIPATADAPADASHFPKPYRDPAMTAEIVHSSYQHLFGGYLALADHFEATGDTEQAAIYNEKYASTLRFELNLYKLSDEEKHRQDTEVLPPLLTELHALTKKHLGY